MEFVFKHRFLFLSVLLISLFGRTVCGSDKIDDGYHLPADYNASYYPPTSVYCAEGFSPSYEQCYRILSDWPLPTVEEAHESCTLLNGALAEAKDDFTNGAIYAFTEKVGSPNGTIIGAKCKKRRCKKLITFGSRDQTYKAWAFKEPSGQANQLCVITNFRKEPGAWNNVNCNCINSTYPCRFQAVCQTRNSCPKVEFADQGLSFNETTGGMVADSLEKCSGFPNSAPKATRRCEKYSLTAFWEPFNGINLTNCDEENVKQLEKFDRADVTSQNADEISQSLINVTGLVDDINLHDLEETLNAIVALNDTKDQAFEITENVVSVIDKLIERSEEGEAERDPTPITVTPRFIEILEKQVTNLQRNGSNFTIERQNFRIKGLHIPRRTFTNKTTFSLGKEFSQEATGDDNVNITFPEGLLQTLVKGGDGNDATVALTIIDYSNTVLFENERSRQRKGKIASSVVGITFEGISVRNLTKETPIVITFPIEHSSGTTSSNNCASNLSYTCSFWDFNLDNGNGDWSSEGCETVDVTKDVVTCHCFHLTNLSVLVHESTNRALQFISKIGCALSMVGLAITIAFFFFHRKIRSKESMKIQMNMCIAFLFFYAVFLGGIERKPFPCDQELEEIICTASAALINYFALSSMAWMCVEALHMYMLFVRATGSVIPRFLLFARMFGWGFPAALVTASLARWYDDYTAESYCFLAWKGPLKFILLPFQGLMFTFNAVCYILVALRLVCSKEMGSTKSAWQIASRRVRNAVAIASLLGMSWAFGFISLVYVDDTGKTTTTHGAPNIFDVLFCVTLSMKGIIVFVLFCLRREEFWEPWRKVTDLVSRTGRVKDGQCQQYISNEGTTTNLHKSSLPSSGDSTATV
ncbi:Adhesion G-protein coupled receptor G7 [Holothuria leucospilota]|uniref:Adhesion G-protein coupled receptor G7 n=1 Tax=Holothuria leucospilota TaxID=206669 RepID=A0A9Q1CL10_HOLLE|nr:Adhesion G-protein coupled receptor G7 [Holothuria leucospilota]